MKPVRFLRPAEMELLDAVQYYESQAPGLGKEFLGKIDNAVCDIGKNPERWPVVRHEVRRRFIHRFPYALLYRVDLHEAVVQAVMHLHRRPNYWLAR